MTKALFPLGKLYITPGALAACKIAATPPPAVLTRHATGDWSEMSEEDQHANQRAIEEGSRILSAYQVGGRRFFVITEADRSSTTILLAEEY